MRELSEMTLPSEVDAFIDEICRNMPPGWFHARAEAGSWTSKERAADPKLDAVCKALERRAKLEKERYLVAH